MEASYEMCFVMYNEEMSSSRHMTCRAVKTNTHPDIYRVLQNNWQTLAAYN